MNTLNYSFRYLANRRGNTLARFVSISLGLLVALLIFSYVGFNLSYDRCFTDRDRIYKVWQSSPKIGYESQVPLPLAEEMAAEIPQIEAVFEGSINGSPYFEYNDHTIETKGCLDMQVESNFFDTFGVEIISGDPKLLDVWGNIMISERMARQIFGKSDPVGKELYIDEWGYQKVRKVVCGVYKTLPANTSLGEFDYMHFRPIREAARNSGYENISYWGLKTNLYFKLREGARIEDVERNLAEICKRHKEYIDATDISYHLVPLKDNYFMDNNIRKTQLLLSMVGILALAVACLNYVLLSISSLAERSRTIAMLRCHGAQKRDIFKMFSLETILIVGAAIVWTAFMIWCLDKEIFTLTGYHNDVLFAWERIWIPLVVCLVAFLLSGLIPALLFANVKLSRAFRGGSDSYRFWKRGLLFVQMTCTITAVIFLAVCLRQMHYVQTVDKGYNVDNIYSSIFAGTSYANLASARDAIKRQSCVEEVAFHSPIYSIVSNLKNFSHTYYVDDSNEFRFVVTTMPGDYTLSDMLKIPLVEGRMFAEDEIEYGRNLLVGKVLINETFKKMMGLNESPVGKIFRLGDDDYGTISYKCYEIIGVLKDFYIGRGELKPVMIENYNHNPDMSLGEYATKTPEGDKLAFTNVLIRFKKHHTRKDRDHIEALMKEYAVKLPSVQDNISLSKIEDRFKKLFEGERKVSITMLVVCVITLIIALSGLIGYMDNEMQRRRKEIAIRKVAGATVGEVMVMVAADLLWITIPATAFGVVIAYMAGSAWMQTIAGLRAPLSWWIFAAGAMLVLAVVYAIQIARTWHTATANPIEMIKTE